ncbi:MAG TPA: helix-turn-helix domain-containing protein [Thermoanaerobaculia bacterium]|nr:helix-turn-helix domain-containing protein [Thermoanaerobaculia bacterium]
MIGERIRQARQAQQLSLAQVSSKAKISAATLSRIETEKQNIDLGLFLIIAKVLHVTPHELLGDMTEAEGDGDSDPLVRRIAALDSPERTKFWRELMDARRNTRTQKVRNVGQQVEELLAQVDFLREEILSVRSRMRRR